MNASSFKRRQFPSKFIVALLVCCGALVLSSCSKKASTAIIGKWRAEATKETVEFRKDGTVITSHDVGQPGIMRSLTEGTTGKYTFTDGTHMNVQISTGGTNNPN